eukprot:123341-Chlamydomonas_euryale.AAC.1
MGKASVLAQPWSGRPPGTRMVRQAARHMHGQAGRLAQTREGRQLGMACGLLLTVAILTQAAQLSWLPFCASKAYRYKQTNTQRAEAVSTHASPVSRRTWGRCQDANGDGVTTHVGT